MRRNLISKFQPVQRRSGVMSSVSVRKRRVQTPVSWVMSSIGFAPSSLCSAAHAR